MKKTMIGLDLDRENAQISYYNERCTQPETVSLSQQEERYLIPVPADLFKLIEGNVELGQTALANFLKTCISYIKPVPQMEDVCIMVTMKQITQPWADALRLACQMLGIRPEDIFLQTHQESFCCYTLNQKRELWSHRVALFEYEDSRISSYVMKIDYSTRPALVSAEPEEVLDLGRQGNLDAQQWDKKRDGLFLNMIREVFRNDSFSAIYLIGDSFDKTWAVESLQFLCRRRHVFQGRNLYTKGACYGAMQRMGIDKKTNQLLYFSPDMVTVNLSMQMDMRGKTGSYMLISAGVNWFEAEHTCEFIADDTNEIEIFARSMEGGAPERYSIVLKGLEPRKGRTMRLWLQARFTAQNRCRVTVRDLGFGEFYPPSGKVWESTLEV